MYQQLQLFHEEPTTRMQREIDGLHAKYEKLRKGQYAKLNELNKLYRETKDDVEIIKSHICKTQTRII